MWSLCVNIWRSYASLWTANIGNMQFSSLFSDILWHIELTFCIWFCVNVLQIKFECRHFASIFERGIPLSELRIQEMWSFLHGFSYMRWHIELNFCIWLCFWWTIDHIRVLSLCVNFQKLLCLFLNLEYRKCEFFLTFLLHALRYWADILHIWLYL